MFYSKSTNGFYSPEIHGSNIPDDAVELSDAEYKSLLTDQSNGKVIKSDKNGFPMAVERQVAKQTKHEVEEIRLRAYADPVIGSDRFFAEASRLQAIGAPTEEIEAAKAAGAQRYQEIQMENPWPAE